MTIIEGFCFLLLLRPAFALTVSGVTLSLAAAEDGANAAARVGSVTAALTPEYTRKSKV